METLQALTLSGNEITDTVRAAARLGNPTPATMIDSAMVPAGVGVWRAATNLFRRGQCDAATDWNAVGAGVAVARDGTVAGVFSLASIKVTTANTAAGEGVRPATATAQAAAATTWGSGSVWFKGVAGSVYRHQLQWTNTDASTTLGAQATFTATGNWQLVTPASVQVAAGKTGDKLDLLIATNTQRAESFWAAHAMLEKAQRVAAPYVVSTGGAAATNVLDRIRMPATLLDETAAWVAMRVLPGWAAASPPNAGGLDYLLDWRDDANNLLGVYWDETANLWTVSRKKAGAGASVTSATAPPAIDIGVTVIAAFTATQVKVSINGAAFTAAGNTQLPVLAATQVDVLSNAGANQFNGRIVNLLCGTGAVADADAALIHADLIVDGPAGVRHFADIGVLL